MIRVFSIIMALSGITVTSAGMGAADSNGRRVHWIWSDTSRDLGAEAPLLRQFSVNVDVEWAMLRCHAEFCVAVVRVNGVQVHWSEPYDSLPMVDVRRYIRRGENEIAVHAVGNGGPSAVAVELVVTSEDGEQYIVVSDASWEVESSSSSGAVVSRGRVDLEPWWHIRERPATSVFDEYNQWEEALGEGAAVGVGRFQLASGFRIERVYQAREGDGSWISLALDPSGRLILGKEKTGLLRLTLSSGEGTPKVENVEVINDSLRGCHGLLWAHDSLYANASESKKLFRMRDTDGDDAFDEVRELKMIPGGTGDHGRNDLILRPDGGIYLIHGDAVGLPGGFQSRVPWTREFRAAGRPLGGHLVRTGREGKTWEVIASGLRNPYGIDENEDGELFTYDADSERHSGLPWYRPTRMNHLVPGTDYGWRRDDTPWPIYHPDSLPPNVLIGKGSPTGVKFGTRSSFPPAYRRAMFALDWAYGRIFAVHVVPRGASYSMHVETFLRGRPFNVVDLDFAADGSMYLITGGYETRSALYRIRYVGPPVAERLPSDQEKARNAYARRLRKLRRRLESLHHEGATDAVEIAWSYLDHPDRWIRHAARTAIEHQPVSEWDDRLASETRPERILPALLALVRMAVDADAEAIHRRLARLSLGDLPTELQLAAIRVVALLDTHVEESLLSRIEALYPSGDRSLDRELCQLLAHNGSANVIPKTLAILATEPTQGDKLHYLSVLSEVRVGWTDHTRSEFFRMLRGARIFQGDEGMPAFVRGLELNALENVPEAERDLFQQLLAPDKPAAGDEPIPARPFVKKWTLSDLQAHDTSRADIERGAALYRDAQCVRCHRLGTVGQALGPDLTGVSARFSRREILEAIITPSKVISSRYRNHVVETRDGRVFHGQVVWNGFRKSILRIAVDPMRLEEVHEISKRDIVSYEESPTSPMPDGLLDTLTREEILDLLAYIETGGRQQD